jgi:hypothetical protein
MTNIKERFQTRTWSAADLAKINKIAMSVFAVGSVLCLLMFDVETGEHGDKLLLPGMAILAVVCAGVVWWLNDHAVPEIRFAGSTAGRLLGTLFKGAVLGVVGMGYLYLINAVTGSPAPVMVQGPVVGLVGTSAERNVTVRFEGRDVTFTETGATHAQLKEGDVYRTEAHLGGLGFYWRPGWSDRN